MPGDLDPLLVETSEICAVIGGKEPLPIPALIKRRINIYYNFITIHSIIILCNLC